MRHPRQPRRARCLWIIGLALACTTARAHAQPAGGDDEAAERDQGGPGDAGAAESLVRAARALMDGGRYDEACTKLEQALEAGPSGTIAMLLGGCFERQGKLASAWAAYRQAVTRLKTAGGEELAAAEQAVARVEPRVPKLTIRAVAPPPNMVILRNDTRFGAGVLEVPLAVDPGRHTIVASAEGHRGWSADITLQAGERRAVTIPRLAEAPVASARATAAGTSPWFTAGVITAGAGAAALVTGGILGAVAAREVQRAESDPRLCPGRVCTPAGRDHIDAADAKAIGASVAFGAGAVLVAAGIAFLVVEAARVPDAVALVPVVSTGGGALMVRIDM